jgi:hypothetical protein
VDDQILRAYAAGADRVLVDSPPGAGKTYLVEQTCAKSVNDHHWRVGVGTNTRNQRDDFAVRFRLRFPRIPIQVALASKETPSQRLRDNNIPFITKFNSLNRGPGVVVSTVQRHFYSVDYIPHGVTNLYDLMIADEAYQMQYRNGGLPLDALGRRRLMVGDPGQISPFTELDTEVFESARDRVLSALPDEILRSGSRVHSLALNVSRRLPPDTVSAIQPALYPNLPFNATSTDAERRVAFAAVGIKGDVADRALDLIASGASIVAIQLPDQGFENEVDDEICDLAVEVSERIRQRRGQWPYAGRAIDIDSDLFYIDSHVNSVTRTQERLVARSIALRADTPNVIQGQETLISIVKHPLSSMQEADTFHLDPGRLCVMLSRHKLACIILVRGDVSAVLDDYEHDAGERLLGREDVAWRGYSSHRKIWDYLISNNRIIS